MKCPSGNVRVAGRNILLRSSTLCFAAGLIPKNMINMEEPVCVPVVQYFTKIGGIYLHL